MADKLYFGHGAVRETPWGGQCMRLSVKREDVAALADYMDANGDDWANIDILEKRQATGKTTHYGAVDTWRPNAEQAHDERRGAALDDAQSGRPAATRAYSPNPLRPYPTHDQPPPRRPVGPPPPPTPDDGDVSELDDDIPF